MPYTFRQWDPPKITRYFKKSKNRNTLPNKALSNLKREKLKNSHWLAGLFAFYKHFHYPKNMNLLNKLNNKGGLEILLLPIILVGGLILAGGYIGVIPRVSSFLKTDQPRNLGIDITKVDVKKVQQKIGITTITAKATDTTTKMLKFEGQKNANYSLTNEELSALLNNSPWQYYPFSNVQVKVAKDGTVEASGIFNAQKVFGLAKELGLDVAAAETAMENYKISTINAPVYLKGSGSIENGTVTLNISSVELGRLPLPQNIIEQATPKLTELSELVIKMFPGFSVKSLTFENEKMLFNGTIPQTETIFTR